MDKHETQIDIHRYSQIFRKTDRQIYRQIDRETDRQRDR